MQISNEEIKAKPPVYSNPGCDNKIKSILFSQYLCFANIYLYQDFHLFHNLKFYPHFSYNNLAKCFYKNRAKYRNRQGSAHLKSPHLVINSK